MSSEYNEVLQTLKDMIDKLETGFYGRDEDFNISAFAEEIETFNIHLYENLGAIVDE